MERVIGSGAMGTVFRAVDESSGLPVALKILRGAGQAARFEREIDLLSKLDHPGIVRYVGHGVTVQGEPFLAMEWIEGVTLRSLLSERGLDLHETLRLGIGIASALAAAHRAGVVHRDVKPSNLLLAGGRVDHVKLIDFGIARSSVGIETLTDTGALVGTPSYMAPEQATHAKRVGPAADVFALGCILHECLLGTPLFSTVRQDRDGPPPRLVPSVRTLRPDVPEAVVALVERMLSRSVSVRIADGACALMELERLRALELPALAPPVVATAPQAAAMPRPPLSRSGFSPPRDGLSAAPLNHVSARTLDVLARYVPMPMAVLRAQCERIAKDADNLSEHDLAELCEALADAVARFTTPGSRALVLAELRALAAEPPRS